MLLAAAFVVAEPRLKITPRPLSVNVFAESKSIEQGTAGTPLPAPGASIARELSAGETHSYQLTLDANQYLRATFEQQGLDVALTLYGTDGQMLVQLDGRRYGPTPVSIIAETDGMYRLDVRSLERGAAGGRYALKVEEARPATARDKQRVAAERTFAEAEQLLKEWRADSSRGAIDKFKDSLPLWRAAGDHRQESLTLKRIGDTYWPLGDYQSALTFYDQALRLSRKTKDHLGESEALNEIGYVYLSLGDKQKPLEYCSRAFELSQRAGDRRGDARALNNLGEVYNWAGDLQKALNYYRRALNLWVELGDRRGQAQTNTYLGYTYSDLGRVREAFDYYNQALSLWRATDDRRGEAITLTAIGRLYSRTGESQEALAFFERATQLIKPIGDPFEEASILTGIAYVNDQLGERRQAIEYYDRALALFRAIGHSLAEATSLYDAGRAYYALGESQQALDYYQRALSISRAAGDRRMEFAELKEIGKVYDSLGEEAKALNFYQQALSFWRAEKDFRAQVDTLNPIGHIYEEWGQKPQALDYYKQALTLSRKAEYPYGEAATLHNIARVERDRGHLSEARAQAEQALKVIESLREKVDSQDLRASYFASVRQQYEFYIDLLMLLHREHPSEGYDAAAFDASERARARSLLETLKESRADNPHYAPLTLPQPLTLKEVQQQVLNDNTLLLEYTLGDEKSYLWAVTKTEVSVHELPKRAEIEDAARRLYGLLTARQPVPGETFEQHQERADDADGQYWQQADGLSRMILGPVAGQLGTKRLIVVADGALQYIPFQSLPAPGATLVADADEMLPLMLTHEVVNEPSASCLAVLGSETNRRPPAPKAIAVLADPVFEKDDPRVEGSTQSENVNTEQHSELHRALRDVGVIGGGSGIPRLLASRVEAEAIMGETPPGAGLEATGFDASRATATSGVLSQYRIVHFATHGLLNNEHPELSGLVLSLVDREGQPQDGFLRLHDIYNLKLPADLVVLSACNTGLGKDVKGEGLVGLTRGFMYAGASGVVASLWKVDDEATAELMKNFYEAMLKRGLPPSAALREAQVAMWKQKRWRAPYYWAAFVIQGQYKEREGFGREQEGWAGRLAPAGAGAFALSLVAFYAVRRRRKNIL